eukprot:SAG22_NODE_627_length_8410_cov_9.212249_4_plen_66_part_00
MFSFGRAALFSGKRARCSSLAVLCGLCGFPENEAPFVSRTRYANGPAYGCSHGRGGYYVRMHPHR